MDHKHQSKHIRANVCFYEDSLQWNGTTYEPTYTCFISTTSIIDPNTRIMSWLEGKHRDGKSFDDVEAISFKNTSVHYFPLDLDKFFPNLRIVKIENCGLKSITRSDLNGLENIDTLFCPGNRITSLPNNLFTGMYKLRSVVFRRNRIKIMSSKVFTPIIKNLIRLDLTENVSIDAGST
ncbi:CLUMA_CG018070, isoform A [Clunio marinus]|uniref:CLUMA_CG018070, isoform A n=1 Tax=Clunio marinus TaxID=568069 RepID=A0A1J1IZP8_9DIPT|nr:CLUMA_CG018070, isoform A [Clunio marinus]